MTDWRLQDSEFKRILARHNDPENELASVVGTIAELVPHLKTSVCWHGLPKVEVAQVKEATTFHSLNRAIEKLYDYADDNKIWLGLMPLEKGEK